MSKVDSKLPADFMFNVLLEIGDYNESDRKGFLQNYNYHQEIFMNDGSGAHWLLSILLETKGSQSKAVEFYGLSKLNLEKGTIFIGGYSIYEGGRTIPMAVSGCHIPH